MPHLESQTKMRDALFDLEKLLRSREGKEALTIQESNILISWRSQVKRDMVIGYAGANLVSMLGPSAFGAIWNFGRSVESCAERFLSLEGSRIQRELANIMLRKYSDDPWVLRRLAKHFHLEEVYEDSSADKPKFRWHRRNFFGDPGLTSNSQNASYNEIKTESCNNDVKKTAIESEAVYVNSADASQNPFDFVFGLPGSAENIPCPKTSSTSSGRSSLRERRTRHKHRRHHQEDSDV